MKMPTLFQALATVLVSALLFVSSCRREVEVPLPALPTISGKPTAATMGGSTTSATGTDKINFRVDLYVVDRSGRYVQGLKATNFGITASNPTSFTYTLTNLELVGQTAKAGGYSAMLLLDQSGSILSTDPGDLRIEASKIFLDYLGANDQVALSSFTGSYNGNVRLHKGFSRNTTALKKTLDTLARSEGGGTPLYYSTVAVTDYTAQNGPTANRAVIVFTDGEDTYYNPTLAQTIANAKAKNTPLYMVGLSTDVNVAVLSQMANETGGAFFFAKDAEQLVTSFGTLGNLLRGSAQLYRTTWTAARRTGKWATGNTLSETIKITLPNGDSIDAPFYVQVP